MVKKSKETSTGRNTHFEMTRTEFVKQIKKGNFPDHHVRIINGVETPCSNPNNTKKDNLG